MAIRNRVIYQSEALFVGKTGDTTLSPLHRIQSANYSFDLARQDVNQFGQLAAIDRIILEQPTVALDFSYYPTSGYNESKLGFSMGANSAISAMLSGASAGAAAREDVKNYYIGTWGEGSDVAGATDDTTESVIGIGNGFLTSYSVEGSVGDFVTATVNIEGLNMRFDSATVNTVANPAVNPVDGTAVGGTAITIPDVSTSATQAGTGTTTPMAIRPGDVKLTLDATDTSAYDHTIKHFNITGLKTQNFTYSFELSRENIEKLGSKFAFSREIEFPTTASMDASSIVGETTDANKDTDALIDFLDQKDPEVDLIVSCEGFEKSADADSTVVGIKYELLGAKLDSYGISSSIGDNKSLDMTWTSQIGGPQDLTHGIKISVNTV